MFHDVMTKPKMPMPGVTKYHASMFYYVYGFDPGYEVG
jgi:hypothetical protein